MSDPVERALHDHHVMILVLGAYVSGLVIANAIAAKLVIIAGVPFTAGAVAYPLTFVLQDVISERWGRQVSRSAIWAGFVGACLLVAYSQGVEAFPDADPGIGVAYEIIFEQTPRIVLASMSAYLVGSLVDVAVFFMVREATGPSKLWLRKLASTVVSQWVDSLLFVVIAFAGVLKPHELFAMGIAQYLFKMACMVVGLPVSYALLRSREV